MTDLPPLIDSHAHLDFEDFEPDRDEILARAKAAGLRAIVTIGTNAATSWKNIVLSKLHPGFLFPAVGIHPHDADKVTDDDWRNLEQLAADPAVVAIGETGLDYFKGFSNAENQKILFRKHVHLAMRLDKPVIIHCRDAHADLRKCLADWGVGNQAAGGGRQEAGARNQDPGTRNQESETTGRKSPGVIHCFSGTADDVAAYAAMGFFISVAGPVTFKNADPLRAAARTIPLDRLMVETDCPFLAPQKYRGKRNEPAYVRETAEQFVALLGRPYAEIAAATTANAARCFGLPVA